MENFKLSNFNFLQKMLTRGVFLSFSKTGQLQSVTEKMYNQNRKQFRHFEVKLTNIVKKMKAAIVQDFSNIIENLNFN